MIEKHLERIKKIKETNNEMNLMEYLLGDLAKVIIFAFLILVCSYFSIETIESVKLIKEAFDPLSDQLYSMPYFEARKIGINLDEIHEKYMYTIFFRELTLLVVPFILFILNLFFVMTFVINIDKKEIDVFKMTSFCLLILSLITIIYIFCNFYMTLSLFGLAYAPLFLAALSITTVICMFCSFKNQLKLILTRDGIMQLYTQRKKNKKEIVALELEKESFYEQIKKDRSFLANKSNISGYNPKNDMEKKEIEKILKIYKEHFNFVINLEIILNDSNKSIVNKTTITND